MHLRLVALTLLVAAAGATAVGCGGFLGGSTLDLGSLLTCATQPKEVEADLQWADLSILNGAGNTVSLLPGEEMQLQMLITNASDPDGDTVSLPSNIQAFLSFDARLDAHDYAIGNLTVNGIEPNGVDIKIESLEMPRPSAPPTLEGIDPRDGEPYSDKYFPEVLPPMNPGMDPAEIGPLSITYNLIVVVDAANCVLERMPNGATEPSTPEHERYLGPGSTIPTTYNPADIALNNQIILIDAVTLRNPNLPNLQCRFREVTPTEIGQIGGIMLTEWEITNTGLGPAMAPFDFRVYFSEDEDLDQWDANITTPGIGSNNGLSLEVINDPTDYPPPPAWTWEQRLAIGPDITPRFADAAETIPTGTRDDTHVITESLNGGEVAVWTVRADLPWYTVRQNQYTFMPPPGQQISPQPSSPLNTADGQAENARWRWPSPPNPVSAWVFTVYAPIPDVEPGNGNVLIGGIDNINTIEELDETDNLSSRDGGNNGSIRIMPAAPSGSTDLEAIGMVAFYDNQTQFLNFSLEVANNGPARNVSIGFFYSADDRAQSSDYYSDRFWVTIPTSESYIIEFGFFQQFYTPGPGSWHVVAVLDDVLAIGESDETNNVAISDSPVQIGTGG